MAAGNREGEAEAHAARAAALEEAYGGDYARLLEALIPGENDPPRLGIRPLPNPDQEEREFLQNDPHEAIDVDNDEEGGPPVAIMDAQALDRMINSINQQTINVSNQNLLATYAGITGRCDGSAADAIRTWIDEVGLCGGLGEPGKIKVARRTAAGAFRKELEDFITTYRPDDWDNAHHWDPNNTPWEQVVEHMTQAFLSVDEKEYMRGRLDTIKQASDTIQNYNRRFRAIADVAYPKGPNGQRDAEAVKTVLSRYAKGIYLTHYAKKIVDKHPPFQNLAEAMRFAVRLGGAQERFDRLGRSSRQEEPMEVGMVDLQRPSEREEATPAIILDVGAGKKIDALVKALGTHGNLLADNTGLMRADAATAQTAPIALVTSTGGKGLRYVKNGDPNKPRGRPRERLPDRNEQGERLCYRCKTYGHVATHCEAPKPLNWPAGK